VVEEGVRGMTFTEGGTRWDIEILLVPSRVLRLVELLEQLAA
jgi:hypothetical protein